MSDGTDPPKAQALALRERTESAVFTIGVGDGEHLEPVREADEGPRHRLRLPRAFAAGVYEVMFAEWDACLRAGGCDWYPPDKDWGRGRRPVINVSWEDAQQYLAWLSGRTGQQYRLFERGGMGVRGARGNHDSVPHGSDDHPGAGQLQWGTHLRRWRHRHLP